MSKTEYIHLWFVLLPCAWLIACGTTSPAASYFSLSALAVEEQSPSTTRTLPAIGVGPVMLPDYLNRPQFVTRIGPNQMRVDEYHRWAGELEQEMVRVLTENLITLTGSDRIVPIPWPSDFSPDIAIRLDVYAFEGASDGSASLRATITLVGRDPDTVPLAWRVDLQQQAESQAYEALVAAQSRLLAALSREIAQRILKNWK